MIAVWTFAALALGYLLGSIPFGIVLTKLFGAPDPRTIGSHNIGATNVLRTGRKGLAAATLLLDALKGTVAIWIASDWGEVPAMAAAFGAFMGHLYPVWLSYKGGKGVAIYLGCLLGLNFPSALAFISVWIAVAAATRYSSAAALCACAMAVLCLFGLASPLEGWLFACLGALLYYKHGGNIARLIAGTESKIGDKP